VRAIGRSFTSWSAAVGQISLPATPAAVVGFLTAVPRLSPVPGVGLRSPRARVTPPTTVTALLRTTRCEMTRRQRPRYQPTTRRSSASAVPLDKER